MSQKSIQKVVAITGGWKGVGLQTARHFASLGWNISICGRDKAGVEFAARSLQLEFGVEVIGSIADVASETEMQNFAKHTLNFLGPVDTLISNAAILGPVGKVADVPIREIFNTFAVNVVGAYNAVSTFWDQLRSSLTPRVITISGGGLGGPNQVQMAPAYVPSKAALAAFTEILAADMRLINGSAISVALGSVIPTDFLKEALTVGVEVAGQTLFDEAVLQKISKIGNSLDDFYVLLDYLMTEDALSLNGSMLSAKWNKVADLVIEVERGIEPNMYLLRRIDGHLFRGTQ